MNCKPGDLAVIVVSGPRAMNLVGRMVTVTELYGVTRIGLHAWRYECPGGCRLLNEDGEEIGYVEDCALRPIRPSDLEDEAPNVRELEAA